MKVCSQVILFLTIGLTFSSNAWADRFLACSTVPDSLVRHKRYIVILDKEMVRDQEIITMTVGTTFGGVVKGNPVIYRRTMGEAIRYSLDYSVNAQGKLIPQQFALEEPSRQKSPSKGYILHFVHDGQNLSRPCFLD